MRNSRKREDIIKIFKNRDLLTAQEVCIKLPEIDRATIYRNISLFVEQGILREVNVKKGISSYELNVQGDHHQHFICSHCEKVIPVEFDEKVIKKIIPSNIIIEDVELNLKGKCEDCK